MIILSCLFASTITFTLPLHPYCSHRRITALSSILEDTVTNLLFIKNREIMLNLLLVMLIIVGRRGPLTLKLCALSNRAWIFTMTFKFLMQFHLSKFLCLTSFFFSLYLVRKKKKEAREMNFDEGNYIKNLKAIVKIQARLESVHNVNDPLRPTVINTARSKFNRIFRFFMDRRKVTVSSKMELRAVILLREQYGWGGRVKIIVEANKHERIVTMTNENGVQLVD